MKKLFVTLCGIAVFSNISGHAFAQDTNCPHKFPPEMKAKMEQKRAEFDKKLNLTADQKEKMKTIHQASREKIKPLFESIKAEKTKLNQLKQCNASEKDIQAQKDKLKNLKNQIKAERKADFQQVQAILTPDQQKIFNEMHKEHKKHKNFDAKK